MHYEELQLADTSFKTHERLQIFKQPDSQLLYKKNTSSITHSGKYPKRYRRTFNKNIGSGSQISSQ